MGFTFHYGSILIRLALADDVVCLIYIPLWFYSNSTMENKKLMTPEFTFHYGSILIGIDCIYNVEERDLHSTMVLF